MSVPTPAGSDRNLLFGILALQLDFISRDALIAAMHAWVLDKVKPLGEILVAQQTLSAERRGLLEALVREHLRQHGDDPQKSLAAVSSIGSVREELKQVADGDVQASLAHVSAARKEEDPYATQSHSLGTPTSSGLRFRILRPHAKGGLGQVSVALDEELHREVALKEIQGRHADHPESRARFLLEAEVTGGLEHPGIVPVYGLGQYEDGRPFYAMRFIRGDNLQAAIARFHEAEKPGRDPGERALALRGLLGRFVDVCNAIAYAHSRGILHRDLKPGNVMLGQYGETLVVDWGLAKPVGAVESATASGERPLQPSAASGSAATEMGRALGTPAYMSPEQAAGHHDRLGPASDVYSLGATIYHLLTGKAPFAQDEAGDILQRVQRGDFLPPRRRKPELSAALEAVCLKAMALRPEHRYSTVKALAEDVEHWLAGEPVSAWPEPWTVRARRWLGRHRTAMTATAAAVLVAVVSLGVATVLLTAANEEERKARDLAQRKQKEAQENEIAAVAARKDLEKANDQLERTLARSFLRPLGLYRRNPLMDIGTELGELTDGERTALEELARTGSRRLALRFIEDGSSKPVSSRQLLRRADYALHAAIGLDPERRALVEIVLRKRLEERLPAPQATDLAQLAARLGDLTPETSTVVGRVLAEAIRKPRNQEFPNVRRGECVTQFRAVADRLGQEGSRKVVRPLITAWLTAPDQETLDALVEVLKAVGGRLDPELAGEAADALLTANLGANAAGILPLLEALQAVGARLPPERPRKAADILLARMAKAIFPADLANLAEALAAVGGRLDAARAGKGVDILLEVLVTTRHPENYRHVTRGLRALQRCLDSERARKAVEAVLAAMAKAEDPHTVYDLAWSLRTLPGDLNAEQGGKARDALIGAIAKANHPPTLGGLAEQLQALAGGLDADRARKAVVALVGAMARSRNDSNCNRLLAETQHSVSARLDAAWAATQAVEAADSLLATMAGTSDAFALPELASGIKALIGRLDPPRAGIYAAKAAELLRRATVTAKDAFSQLYLAKAFRPLSRWLDAEEAGKAADALLAAMDNTNKGFRNQEGTEGVILREMAEGLGAIIGQLDAERIGKVADMLLAGVVKAKDREALCSLAWRLKAIGGWLDAGRARKVGVALVAAMARTEDLSALDGLAEALGALGPQLDAEGASKAAEALLAALVRPPTRLEYTSARARLPRGLAAIGGGLNADGAATVAAALVVAMAKERQSYLDNELETECFRAILSREHPKCLSRRLWVVVGAFGGLSATGTPVFPPAVLQPPMKPVPPPLPAQVLVNLLKHPLCVGPARRAVLDQLQRHYGRPFADQWDFVRFVRERQLPLDLTRSPQRPLPTPAKMP